LHNLAPPELEQQRRRVIVDGNFTAEPFVIEDIDNAGSLMAPFPQFIAEQPLAGMKFIVGEYSFQQRRVLHWFHDEPMQVGMARMAKVYVPHLAGIYWPWRGDMSAD
jgi:hypothetical protein